MSSERIDPYLLSVADKRAYHDGRWLLPKSLTDELNDDQACAAELVARVELLEAEIRGLTYRDEVSA